MNEPVRLSYQDVCKFISGEKDLAKLSELEKETPVYGIFSLLKNNFTVLTHYADESSLTFNESEAYLEKYLAGNFDKHDAYALTRAILASERNFKKINYIIEQHAIAIAEMKNQAGSEHPISDKEILIQLLKLKNQKPDNNFHFHRKKIISGMLAAAAVLLILIILPLNFDNDIEKLYNFDQEVPLDYNNSALRGAEENKEITDSAYNQFKFQFNKGMSEYLAQEYAKALEEWQPLQKQFNSIQDNTYFTETDKNDFILYNAVCRIALSVSEKYVTTQNDKQKLLQRSLRLFKQLPLNNDTEKYYYALALALNNNDNHALKVLSSINNSSEYYDKKIILEEQIKQ